MFLERFEEVVVQQKHSICLTARVNGNPTPDITWLKDNRPLHPSERLQQHYDGEQIKLYIETADSEVDAGDYKCVATNSFGRASHGARVTVDVPDIYFTKPLKKNIMIEETQTLILECETSHSHPTIWMHNGKEVTGMDTKQIIENGRFHKLTIKSTSISDSGEYVCMVRKKETNSAVQVLPKNPEFVKKLEDLEIMESQNGVLEVEVSSESALVTWSKDGQVISKTSHNRYVTVENGFIRKLIIQNASIHDEGEFKCILGDQESVAEVNIIESPPQIVTPLKDVTCTTGDSIVFEIELTKGDALVNWYKDGEELELNDLISLTIDGKKQCLSVRNVDLSDSGKYYCKVGDTLSEARLHVEEALVDFVTKLPEVTLTTKNSEVLLIVELSNPSVEVNWFRKSKIIRPNDKFEIISEGTIRKLIIHNTQDSDMSDYSCIAQNVKTTTKLKVQGNNIELISKFGHAIL